MKLLQSRRAALRVEIRRQQIDALMRAKREQIITFTEQHQRILDMINEGLHTRPASIFIDLEEYYHGCSRQEGKAFASAVWEYLVSSFGKNSISCQGLPQLLTCIIPLMTQYERRQLPCKLLPVIFKHFQDSSGCGASGDEQLLETALHISLDASKQSRCQLSLRQQEIQAIICKALEERSVGSIQLLLLTLANLEQEVVGRHWKAMLREIASRAVGWLNDQRRKMALQLLLLVGRLTEMQQGDAGLARFLLQTYRQSGFSLTLRFLLAQSKKTVLSLQDAEDFLAICPQQIGNESGQAQLWQQIDIYLTIILNFSIDFDPQTLRRVYCKYFVDRLHHFVHRDTASTFLQLANLFLTLEDHASRGEILTCGLRALKAIRTQECGQEALIMGLNLMINNYPVASIFQAVSRQFFSQLMDHFNQIIPNDEL